MVLSKEVLNRSSIRVSWAETLACLFFKQAHFNHPRIGGTAVPGQVVKGAAPLPIPKSDETRTACSSTSPQTYIDGNSTS